MSFDAQSFLDSAVSGANDTKVVPVPVGEFVGIIDKVTPRQWQSKDGTQTGIAIDITWLIEDANVKAQLGRDTVTVRQGIMLDMNEQGALDMGTGRNVSLGRLREAVGLNDPKKPFSFSQLPGMQANVNVSHRFANDETYAEVKGVSRA